MQRPLKDYFQLHFIVLILGFTAILGALISVHSLSTVFFRTGMATVGLWLYTRYKGISLTIPRTTLGKLIGIGFIIALHWFLFFYAAKVSNVAISLAGFSTASLWTSLIEPLWFRRKVSLLEVALGLVVIGGLYLIFLFEFRHILGLSLGILAALLSALFSVMNAKIAHEHTPQVITFYEMLGAAITSLVTLLVLQGSPLLPFNQIIPQTWDWLWLGILSLVCTVYAFASTVDLLKKFSAFTFNLTLNLEPVYGILFAYFIFGSKEQMSMGFYWGAGIILASVLMYPLLKKQKQHTS